MRQFSSDELIKRIIRKGYLYKVRCITIIEDTDWTIWKEITIFDLNSNPVNSKIKKIYTPKGYERLLKDKPRLDKVINYLVMKMGI